MAEMVEIPVGVWEHCQRDAETIAFLHKENARLKAEVARLKQELADVQENYHQVNEQVARLPKESKITKKETNLLSQKEAARVLGVTRETVSRWTRAGTIACIRFGRRSVAYPYAEIVRHPRNRRNNQANG